MMNYQRLAAVVCAGLFALSATLSAQLVFNYNIALTTDEEPHEVISGATGSAFGSLDLETNLLTWNVTFQDLTSGLTAAHFHGPALPGVGASILVDMEPPGEVLGEISGSWGGSATVSDTIKDHILAHMTYINLHSVDFGVGELRGQVVPEPGTYALFAGIIAFAGVVVWRRFRTKRV